MEEMFSEPGKQIQKMAKVLFWLETIPCLILALALGWEKTHYWSNDYEFHPVYFFGFAIVGPLVAYYSSLMMYGFGELIDKVSEIQKSSSISEFLKNTIDAGSATIPGKYATDVVLKSGTKKTVKEEQDEPVTCDDSNLIECPFCGRVQNKSQNVCRTCGSKLDKDELQF